MILLDAFNLIPGAAIAVSNNHWIVQTVIHDINTEQVYVWVRNRHANTLRESVPERAFILGFCEKVRLVGLSVDPGDPNDSNIGIDDKSAPIPF